jgi:dihydrofolate reductase
MTKVVTAHSTSLDGCIAGADDSPQQPLGVGGDRLFTWFSDGDTPSRYYPGFKMSAVSAAVFDEGVSGVGAVIAGRRTYDISEAWGGSGPMPGIPLFVLTHHVPDAAPAGDPPYTFVTEGIERAVEQARAAAAGKDVALMGRRSCARASRPVCSMSSSSAWYRWCSVAAPARWTVWSPGASSSTSSESSTPQASRT